MKIKPPFRITRESHGERIGEVVFVLEAWVQGSIESRSVDEWCDRGYMGVMMFKSTGAVYHNFGGLDSRGKFLPWEPQKRRVELLRKIEDRMRKAGIFYQDIWQNLLRTDVAVLEDIAGSNFEEEVLRMKRQ